jgi:hypothetical protein
MLVNGLGSGFGSSSMHSFKKEKGGREDDVLDVMEKKKEK